MYGVIATLLAGRSSLLTPIAAPIAYVPIKMVESPSFGRISPDNANYVRYREHLRRTVDGPFAMFLPAQLYPCISGRNGVYFAYSNCRLPC